MPSEIQVQGNQRFFFLTTSRLLFASSRLSHSFLMQRKVKKNLWDQGSLKAVLKEVSQGAWRFLSTESGVPSSYKFS